MPDANLLWRDLHVRDVQRSNGKRGTRNVCIEVVVDGVTNGTSWTCGLEFDYANEESFYCRPLRLSDAKRPERMPIPSEAQSVRVAYLPPMSGLASNETRLDRGAVNVRLGEGRTAEVLRNLCYQIASDEPKRNQWETIVEQVARLFGDTLEPPKYIAERGEIRMTYRTRSKVRLDLSSAGRGLQQTLLLLAHLAINPGSVLLLDEPDAHLEIIRQRQIYQLLIETAEASGSQIIAASHSEVVLNEAADRHVVVAFVGKPHRIDDRGSQLVKSLKEIGFEQFYLAEYKGWVLYLEGSTDLAILRQFAHRLDHPAQTHLDDPFFVSIGNQLSKARDSFFGLAEAKPDLVGFALVDGDSKEIKSHPQLVERKWTRREVENYLCQPETLEAFAASTDATGGGEELFREKRVDAMQSCIRDLVPPVALRDRSDPWWRTVKASTEFLDRLFPAYFERLGLRNLMEKTDYHKLAKFVPIEQIDPEVRSVLDDIVDVASRARPRSGDEDHPG